MLSSTNIVNKPITELTPVQALALVNRWAKLKSDFFYDDVDALYELKYCKIVEWVRAGEMIATKVIMRLSPAIESMKAEIANGGNNLETLGYSDTVDDWNLTDEEKHDHSVLVKFCCNDEYEVSFPEDIVAARKHEYQEKLKK